MTNATQLTKDITTIKDSLNRIGLRKTTVSDSKKLKSQLIKLVNSIPKGDCHSVLKKAIGTGIRRFETACYVLVKCRKSDGVDQWIQEALAHPDQRYRRIMCAALERHPLKRFDKQVCTLIREGDEIAWAAVSAAGELKTKHCLDSLIWLADQQTEPLSIRMVQALGNYSHPKAIAHLKKVMKDEESYSRERVFAAIGLARNGKKYGLKYLVRLLDDDDSSTSDKGWAANGLSEIYGWNLDGNATTVTHEAKSRWEKMQESQL